MTASTWVHLPHCPLGHQLDGPLGLRVEAPVEGLHHHQPSALGDYGHPSGLNGIGGEGLFQQHRLARFQRGDGPAGMVGVGQRVVHRVDLVGGQERVIAVKHHRDAVLGGIGPSPLRITGRYRGHLNPVDLLGRLDEPHWPDPRCPQHPESHGGRLGRERRFEVGGQFWAADEDAPLGEVAGGCSAGGNRRGGRRGDPRPPTRRPERKCPIRRGLRHGPRRRPHR